MRTLLKMLVLGVCACGGSLQDYDWKSTWHGQTAAVGIISRGEALKGKHFDSKVNRLQAIPWNALQTLLGAYMITRLDETLPLVKDAPQRERLAVETCAGVMTMLTTPQQLYEGHVVYQLDDWRQGDKLWREVWEAPMMASAIFRINDEQTKKLTQLCGYVSKRVPDPPYRTYSPGDLPQHEELAFPKKLTSSELKSLVHQSLHILDADQWREAQQILNRFDRRFSAALSQRAQATEQPPIWRYRRGVRP